MSVIFKNVFLERAGKRILSDVTFSTGEAAICILFGPSGSGKSSLLRLVNRLDEADGGDITVLGRPVREYVPTELRRRVGMIFQEPRLLDGTVETNIRFAADYHGIALNPEALLEQVGLPGYGARDVRDLSGGEKQRIALTRALAVNPEVLLLDEPTASLDQRSVRQVEALLLRLSEETNLRMIFVTHDVDQVARLGGRGLVLSGGRVVYQGDLLSCPMVQHV